MGKRLEIPDSQYLKGLDEAEERLQEALDCYTQAGAQGLAGASLDIAVNAQERAPVETGDLRGSVFVDLDEDQYAIGEEHGNGIIVTGTVPENAKKATIGFNSRYAADQHEHTEYSHPSMERIRKMQSGGATDSTFLEAQKGQAKYLESVLNEMAQNGELLDLLFGGIADGWEDE